LKELFSHLAEILRVAAQNNLGIFALLIVAISVLAHLFFYKANEKTKIGIFILLFIGVVGFGVAIFMPPSKVTDGIKPPVSNTPQDIEDPTKTISTWTDYIRYHQHTKE
jgi:hypothetical protein